MTVEKGAIVRDSILMPGRDRAGRRFPGQMHRRQSDDHRQECPGRSQRRRATCQYQNRKLCSNGITVFERGLKIRDGAVIPGNCMVECPEDQDVRTTSVEYHFRVIKEAEIMFINAMGLILADHKRIQLGELTRPRALAAIPFGGRYRIIDFMLSNMVNSGITSIGVIALNKYKSLMDHLGTGSSWDLDRKDQGAQHPAALHQFGQCRQGRRNRRPDRLAGLISRPTSTNM